MAILRMTEAQYAARLGKINKPAKKEAPAKQQPSEIEELMAGMIAGAGLPEPVREYPYLRGSRHRLDFCWPSRKIGLEVQGMPHRIKERFEADIGKRALGLLQGWRILEVSGKAIKDGRAIEWLKQLLKEE